MYLLTHGMIKAGRWSETGHLLFSERSLFVLRDNSNLLLLLGGILSLLIEQYRAKKSPPAFLQDPEVAEVSDEIRRQLLTTELIVKLPLDQNLRVTPTRLGFQFSAPGPTLVKYAGVVHKPMIQRFLTDRGIQVAASQKRAET